MTRFLMILTMLLLVRFVSAQTTVLADTGSIKRRSFNPVAMEKYRSDPAFQYEVSAERPRSLWQRFWSSFWEKIGSMLRTKTGLRATKFVLIILASLILLAFVLIVLKMGKGGLFGKKNQNDPLGYEVLEDDIHGINFDAAIDEAINAGKLRFAVRLLYLQTLKQLTDAGIINWQLNKTNIAYVNELSGKSYQQQFRQLTLQFENNWYGDLPIGAQEFDQVRNQFRQFNASVS